MSAIYYHPGLVLFNLWGAWALSWLAAAWWSRRTEKRIVFRRELPYRAVLLIGGVLFFIPHDSRYRLMRLWDLMSYEAVWICIAFAAAGFAFCWWARIYLGNLWSGSITKKGDHRVVDTGPYALVRHPIYTGILLAVLATMIAKGTLLGLIGAIIIAIGIWMKARLEENFLREELGAEAYDSYRRRVPMLVPFGPK
jgi:protein-S-isoprenylcysteine O-methyltransferase Ste14